MPVSKRAPHVLHVESVEDRIVPVLGFAALPLTVQPGQLDGMYDGIVRVVDSTTGSYGTGAVLFDGLHILTAAHVVTSSGTRNIVPLEINYALARNGVPFPVNIQVPVPAAGFTTIPAGYDPATLADDIAMVTLPDAGNPVPGRVMIAPYGATRYNLFHGDPLGEIFDMVGYGMTGIGAEGNYTDRVDRITIPAGVAQVTVTVTAGGGIPVGAPLVIRRDATVADVIAAIGDAQWRVGGGAIQQVGRANVDARSLGDGQWDVRFIQGRRGNAGRALNVQIVTAAGVPVNAQRPWVGAAAPPTDVRRLGWNQLERRNGPNILEYDFDNLTDATNIMGTTGLPNGAESGGGRGDSGGPALIRPNGPNGTLEIAGVASYAGKGPGAEAAKDFTQYINRDHSWGEIGGYTDVQRYKENFINPILDVPRDLVLDMRYQVYGRSNPVGGGPDNITINVRQVDGFLEIHVNNSAPDPRLEGLYYRGPVANIRSLTIRGNTAIVDPNNPLIDDNETIQIMGPITLRDGGPIYISSGGGNDTIQIMRPDGPWPDNYLGNLFIDGGAGTDLLWVDNSQSPHLYTQHTLAAGEQGWSNGLYRSIGESEEATESHQSRPIINFSSIDEFQLTTGIGRDVITIEKSVPVKTTIESKAGNDTVIVGSAASGMALSNIVGPVFVDTGTGTDDVKLNDEMSPDILSIYNFDIPAPGWATGFSHGGQAAGSPYVAKHNVNLLNAEHYQLVTGVGNDQVFIKQTSLSTEFVSTSVETKGGNDEVTIGSTALGMLNIRGKVFTDLGTGAADKITFADGASGRAGVEYHLSASTLAPNWQYTLRRSIGPLLPGNPIPDFEFKNADQINIQTGTQADIVHINATPTIALGTHISTNGENDQVIIGTEAAGLLNVGGDVFVDTGADVNRGPDEGDRITFQDGASTAVAVGYALGKIAPGAGWDYVLERYIGTSTFPRFQFKNAERVDLNTGTQDDTVNIFATPAARNGVFVRTGGGNDTITLGSSTRGLDDILARINVDGQVDRGTLIIDNRQAANKALTVTRTQVTRTVGMPIDFSQVKALLLKTDGGLANVNIEEKDPGVNVEVELQGGNNTVGTGAGQLGFILSAEPDETDRVTVRRFPEQPEATGDQVTVAGSLALTLPPDFTAAADQVFTLIDNQTAQPIVGTFDDLPEGTIISVGGYSFTISYIGNALPDATHSNDVILICTSVPEEEPDDATVTVTTWDDVNRNGLNDDNTPATSVLVNLITANGHVIQALTNTLGVHTFAHLAPGTYSVLFNHTASSTYANHRLTTAGGDSSANPTTGATASFTLSASQILNGIRAGLVNNVAPVGVGDWHQVVRNGTLNVPASTGVLANDPDAENNLLTATLVSGPTNGTLTFNANGSFWYIPDTDFRGIDSFIYRAADLFGAGVETLVTLLVGYTAPVLTTDTTSANEDGTINVSVLTNDTDPDGDALAVLSATNGANGTTTVNADGTITYTPKLNWSGIDTFTYWVYDGFGALLSALATVTVAPVNDAPTITAPSLVVQQNTPLDIDLRTFVTDVETVLDDLVFAVSNAANGTVQLLPDGYTARFTPNTGYSGPANFSLSVTDTGDGANSAATTSDTVATAVNRPPEVGGGLWAHLHPGQTVSFYLAIYDMDGDAWTLDSYTQPAQGSVSPDMVGFTFFYTAPLVPFAGTTTFTVTASDNRGGVITKTITIELQNQPPQGSNVSLSTSVNMPLSIYAPYWDPDGDPVTITSITQPPSGTGSVSQDQYGSMLYTPPTGFTGQTTFSFVVNDGHGGTLTIYVTVTVS